MVASAQIYVASWALLFNPYTEVYMAIALVSPMVKRAGWIRRTLVGLGVAALAALALHFYLPTVWNYSHLDAAHYRSYWKAHWWLVAHLGGGSLALLLGPFQFSGWLRRRYVKAHRWMGRLYLVGVAVGSLAAFYIGMWVSQNRGFGISLLFLDLVWVVTTGMAYIAVMRRQFAAHREWMVRSYVLTFGFVLFRWMMFDLHLLGSLGLDVQLVMLVWIAWTMPLLGAEVWLSWGRTMGRSRQTAQA